MKPYRSLTVAAVLLSLLVANTAFAQAPPAQPQAAATSVKLQIVLGRYEGERRVSSQPYTLIVVPGEGGNVRSGAEVPVPTGVGATGAYTMQQIGSQVDATVTALPDGKYKLQLSVTDRSMFTGNQTAQIPDRAPNVPVFKNTNSMSRAIMSNGETIQFTSVLDKVTNETFRIDVTLTVGNR